MKRSQLDSVIEGHEPLRFKMCMAGAAGVGKTKLLTRYRFNTYIDQSVSTLIDYYPIKKEIGQKLCNFIYYDTAGQERYQATVQSYFHKINGCVLVYDCTQSNSLDRMDSFYEKVVAVSPEARFVIIGNKCDLKKTVNDDRLQKYRQKGIRCFQSSAKVDLNVREAFEHLEQEVLKFTKPEEKTAGRGPLRPDTVKAKNKKCCS